jgi:hypothetical protein
MSRQGGKLKPLKAAKKDVKEFDDVFITKLIK